MKTKPKDKLENNNSLIDLNNAFTNKSYKILVKKTIHLINH